MNRLAFATATVFASFVGAQPVEKAPPDPKLVKLVQDFLAALDTEGDDARLKAVLPFVHKSLITDDGKDIIPAQKPFAYARAVKAVHEHKHYDKPAVIHVVHRGTMHTIGTPGNGETGRIDKYFVRKKANVNGLPAPIHVFIPEKGEPKILNFGSL